MNQNDLFTFLCMGMAISSMVFVMYCQWLRIKELEKYQNELNLQWQAWSAAKMEDFPTARLMAGLARESKPTVVVESAGAKEIKQELVIEQSSG